MLFTFFVEATTGAVRSVVDRENLVRKIHFPRLVIPLSVVLLALFNLGAEPDRGGRSSPSAPACDPMLSWLELPLIVGALVVFAAGVAMLLSALFVHFRDIQPIWEVFAADPLLRLAGDHLDPDGDRQSEPDVCCTSTCSTRWR